MPRGGNLALEYQRNAERYALLRWAQKSFAGLRVVPPGTGICHQINLEYLASVVEVRPDGHGGVLSFPDTVIGADSHTPMVNALGVLGWGVGGIEAEAAMLGQPLAMVLPDVIGMKLTGTLREGVTATDLVLTVTDVLRREGVVGKFVEFHGPGLDHLALEDRATIANMAPEYGATCGYFPVDDETLRYLSRTGRDVAQVALVEAYCRAQGLFRTPDGADPAFTAVVELDLDSIAPALAGPSRPQDRLSLSQVKGSAAKVARRDQNGRPHGADPALRGGETVRDGDVVIAAITSCANTSNPGLMIAAGLLARNALARGLTVRPWVKTSLSPGSRVVSDYLERSGLQRDLDRLGFQPVGYGCMTCIGNSGRLDDATADAIRHDGLTVAAVISGNRNFEGRINADVRANYLASPPLVVAYALAGTVETDLTREPLGFDQEEKPVFLRDVWPSFADVATCVATEVTADLFRARYADVFRGDEDWQALDAGDSPTFAWDPRSTYITRPPFLDGVERTPAPLKDIVGARILGLFLNSVTTDHLSPAGTIPAASPAGLYLAELNVRPVDFNQYTARRGNTDVMMRATFANARLRNQMRPGEEGGLTVHHPSGDRTTIFDTAMRYKRDGVSAVLFADRDFGSGSSRDAAARGMMLLGIRAVIAQSFERIQRTNMIGMGILPLVFEDGASWHTLGITGNETVSIRGIDGVREPRQRLVLEIARDGGETVSAPVRCAVDTADEIAYFRHGGILAYNLRRLAAA